MAAGVFLSFRPEDAAWAERIRDWLGNRAAPGDLGRGADFANGLKVRAGGLEAIVLIIGRTWLTKTLADPSDPARLEAEAALGQKIRVIPVLVDGAPMPAASALPESLKALAHLRPIELSSGRFDSDLAPLMKIKSERAIDFSREPSTPFPGLPDLSVLSAPSVAGIAAPYKEKTARKSAGKRKSAKKAAAKAARKSITKKAVRKGAARINPAKKFAPKKPAAKKTFARRRAAEEAEGPTKARQAVARKRWRRAVNQDLSVDEMQHLASARRAATSAPAEAVDEIVECSVFGPPAAPPGGTVLIQVFLHLAKQAARASFLATTMDASAKLKGAKSLDLPIKRGAQVEIALSANGLAVDDPVQSVVWRGEPAYCQFLATIPAGTSGQSFFPVIRVSVEGKLVGPIKFRLSSDDTASQPTSEPLGDHAGPYRYAFVSYASKDREEVLKRVQMLEILRTKFFQDILSLDPGDRWEKKLYENIDRCDLFLLFWSQAAKDSQWVLKEAEYALAHQQKNPGSEPDLVPVVLEQNVLPPPSLSAFHFNDRISYLISRKP
jgi:hypothetical protein